jgi:hypothetical protein
MQDQRHGQEQMHQDQTHQVQMRQEQMQQAEMMRQDEPDKTPADGAEMLDSLDTPLQLFAPAPSHEHARVQVQFHV